MKELTITLIYGNYIMKMDGGVMKSIGLYLVVIVLFFSIVGGVFVLARTPWYSNQSGGMGISSGDTVVKHEFKLTKNKSNITFMVKGELSQGKVNVRLLDSKNGVVFDEEITDTNRKEFKAALKGVKGTWKMEVVNKGAEGNISYSMDER
ncbi:hypothetical protein [Clostridium folliculivorans]|nr:hypothetical protein [Clostridium folliculivorans]